MSEYPIISRPDPHFSPKECISIHVGRTGTDLGSACWEVYCLEHGIQADGISEAPVGAGVRSFFKETAAGSYVPRAVFVDLDPTGFDGLLAGGYRDLYEAQQFVRGNEGAAGIFATNTNELVEESMEAIARMVEKGDKLGGGFMLFNSIEGGTGSGIGSHLFKALKDEYPSAPKMGYHTFPGPRHLSTVAPFESTPAAYNAVLASASLVDTTDVSVVLDYYSHDPDSWHLPPDYASMNRVVAAAVSAHTKSIRFGGCYNSSLDQINDNMVANPDMHFLVSAYCPGDGQHSLKERLQSVFSTHNHMLAHTNLFNGLYTNCCLLGPGNLSSTDVKKAIFDIVTDDLTCESELESLNLHLDFGTFKFVPGPRRIDLHLMSRQAPLVPGGILSPEDTSLCVLANSSCVDDVFSNVTDQFDRVRRTGQFLNHYEEAELADAREMLQVLEEKYDALEDEYAAEVNHGRLGFNVHE